MKLSVFWMYLLVMFGVTYLIRVFPFVIFRKKIENISARFSHIFPTRFWVR